MSLPRLPRPRLLAAVMPLLLALAGCVSPDGTAIGAPPAPQPQVTPVTTITGAPLSPRQPLVRVANRIEPVAESLCRSARRRNCDFVMMLDPDPRHPANAYQTIIPATGQPVIVMTQALLNMTRNPDELAFVLGHEAAHHVAGHIPRRQGQANLGAVLAGVLGSAAGLSGPELAEMQRLGAGLGALQYSKDFELEADALGAEIAYLAGYDPILGAEFFARLPDPGTHPGSSHPSNAQRQAAVAAQMLRLTGS